MRCDIANGCPTNGEIQGTECVFERKLCVTCSEEEGSDRVRIRVQTDGLPSHCFNTPDSEIVEQKIDFEVTWMAEVEPDPLEEFIV